MLARLIAASAAALALAAPAFAAGPAPVSPDPFVEAPVVIETVVDTDWTGFYVGGQFGWGWVGADGKDDLDGVTFDANGIIGGVTGGYRYDFGRWVVGGELQYDWADADFGTVNFDGASVEVDGVGGLDYIWRVKGIAGYDMGQTLLYGSVGYAGTSVELGEESFDGQGWLIGAGLDYSITDSLSIGGEVMYHQFNDLGDDGVSFGVDATTLQAKATFRF